jgi:hypothetical protein
MNNIEAGFNSSEPIPKWNDGDLEIPWEYLLSEQRFMMLLMVPKKIKSYVEVSDGENIGIEDKLFELWCNKYSKLFREYCNDLDPDNEEEQKLILRIVSGRLTSDDYLNLQKHLEASEDKEQGTGGIFFTDSELEEFIRPYKH